MSTISLSSCNNKTSQKNDRKENTNDRFSWAKNAGSIFLAGSGTTLIKRIGNKYQQKYIEKVLNEFEQHHYLVNNKECYNLFKSSKLKSLGVSLKNADKGIRLDGCTQFVQSFKNKKFSELRYHYKNMVGDISYNMAVDGNNACFNPFNSLFVEYIHYHIYDVLDCGHPRK